MFSVDQVIERFWPNQRPANWQKRILKWILREDEFQRFAARYPHLKGLDMVEQVLEHLDVRCELSERDLEQIPSHGPVVIVANHPLGSTLR